MPAYNPVPVGSQFTETDWFEFVQNSHPGGGNSFTRHTADASMVGIIPFTKLLGFARYALGYNYCYLPNFTDARLQRVAPIGHPLYTNLTCTGFTETPFRPGKLTGGFPVGNTTTSPLMGNRTVPVNPENTLFLEPEVPYYSGITTLRGYTSYQYSRVVMRFAPLPYDLTADEDLPISPVTGQPAEQNRWTEILMQPRMDILSVDGENMTFCEPPATGVVPGRIGQVLVKSDVQLVWHDVPKSWLFVNNVPLWIVYMLGRTNQTSFFGFGPNTLLFVGAKLTRNMWPFADGLQTAALTDPSVTPSSTEDFFEYDVEFLFSYFNPEPGAASPIQYGHNLQPWRTRDATFNTTSGKWFLATWTGETPAAGGRTLLESGEFASMFTWAGTAPLQPS